MHKSLPQHLKWPKRDTFVFDGRGLGCGRGITWLYAQVRAICESLEQLEVLHHFCLSVDVISAQRPHPIAWGLGTRERAWFADEIEGSAQYLPSLTNPIVTQINPTQSTISIEKPYCVQLTAVQVYLFVIVNGAPVTTVTNAQNQPLATTYLAANGGKAQPYQAVTFTNPGCSNFPDFTKLSDPAQTQAILDSYLIRVGADVNCLNDPNFSGPCNPPLNNATSYRFKYVFTDASKTVLSQSDWSLAISTNQAQSSSTIDTWPGRRSGGMIVLTSILSTLMFFVFVAFVATIVSWIFGEPSGMETTRHDIPTRVQSKAPTSTEVVTEQRTYSTHHLE
ncbi:uroplakin-3a [Pelodytes ibericus]